MDKLLKSIQNLLDEIQKNILHKATDFRDKNTYKVKSYNEFKDIINKTGGFIRCGWDGSEETETAIKNETKATIRCIIEDVSDKSKLCVFSKKPAKHLVIFAKAY